MQLKAQSAMEYLMTYGWAILIIGVVAVALYQLGIFTGANLLGSTCVAASGYLCQNFALNTSGTASFSFGQNTGQTLYNVEIACADNGNSIGLPSNGMAWNFLYANGVVSNTINNMNLNNAVDLISGQIVQVHGLQCYSPVGLPLRNPVIGSAYSGVLWINYTSTACLQTPCFGTPPSPNWLTSRALVINTKVV